MSPTTTSSGSDQTGNRSLGGILVHVLALFTSFVGPAIMYTVSDHEFTRENARNVINWHVSVIVLTVVAVMTSFLAVDDVSINGELTELLTVPSPLDTVFTFIAVPLGFITAVAVTATFAYAVIGTLKAVFGSAWMYPGAIDIVGRLRDC